MSNDANLPPEGSQTWEVAYEKTAEGLRLLLGTVTDGESARSFVEEAVRQVKVAAAATPEFYPGEFYSRFRQTVVDEAKAEVASSEREVAEILSVGEAASADLNARLRVVRNAGNQDSEHALWREAAEKKAESQAVLDALAGQLTLSASRFRAVDDLGLALGGSRSATRRPPQFDTTESDGYQPRVGNLAYWIYDNWVHRFSKIHRAACTFCNNGNGIHNRGGQAVAGTWLGPFESLAVTTAAAEATGRRVETCSVCTPY